MIDVNEEERGVLINLVLGKLEEYVRLHTRYAMHLELEMGKPEKDRNPTNLDRFSAQAEAFESMRDASRELLRKLI